jgi:exonuclease SbcC
MRLRRLTFRGLVRFSGSEPVTVDFEALGPGLVALVGENGEGKSTTMEAVPAALYKALPSRDGWYEYWHGRDGYVEALFDDGGQEIKVRVQVDADRSTTEGYVFVDGRAITTGRDKEFRAEISKRFGSYELFIASILGAQKRNGNFLDAPKAARKDRFAELLALGRLQALHGGARDRRARSEQSLDTARAMLAAVAGVADTIAQIEETEGKLRSSADQAAHQLETAREEEAAAVSGLDRAKTAAAAAETTRQAEKEARRRVGEVEAELVRAEEQPARARRDADARRKTVAAAGVDLEGQARKRHTDATAALERRRAALEAQLADAGKVAEAQQAVPALEEAATLLEAGARAVVQAEAEERAAGQRLAAAEQALEHAQHDLEDRRTQLNHEAGLLQQVPCTESSSWVPFESVADAPHLRERVTRELSGACPLLSKARAAGTQAAALVVAPRFALEVEQATKAADAARKARNRALMEASASRLQEVRQQLAELRPLAARARQLEQAREDLEGLGDERIQIDAALEADLREAKDRAARAAQELETIDADLAEALLEAEDAIAAARTRAAAARQELQAAEAALKKACEDAPSIETKQRELAQATATRKSLEGQVREADQLLASCVAKLDEARAQLAVAEQRRLEVKAAEAEVGDWTLLEDALGRDGIQALEIDAAGPEVARLANELLRAGVGPRWTISFETLREKKSSPGEYSEAFDIRVYDEGRERSVEGISGGERVFVGEAIALALAIFNARKSGVAWRTLFRDETSGALSLQNATHYVDMLRCALQLGGFHQVVFIAHQPEVYERADARLVVAGGHVRVEGVERPEAVPA